MNTRVCVSFGIEHKPEIAEILGSSDSIPENELHVKKGTDIARRLSAVGSEVSVALLAISAERFHCPNYNIGYIERAKVVFEDQAKPLMINDRMVEREKKEFRRNGIYRAYEIEVISPPMNHFDYFEGCGALAPYATPDRAE